MEGQVLGYHSESNEGIIKGNDGVRYTFGKEDWKINVKPEPAQVVDFEAHDGVARNIYMSAASISATAANNNVNAIIALLLTLFLGFIGTLVSRLAFAKQDVGAVWLPTLLHFLSTFLLIIPVIGWLTVFGINIYFALKNYRIVGGGLEPASKYG